MKKTLPLTFFFLLLFFFLTSFFGREKQQVRAYETKTCRFFHEQPAEFDNTFPRDKVAVLKNKPGLLMAQFSNVNISCDDYDGWLYWGTGWTKGLVLQCQQGRANVFVWNVSFANTGNYPLAAYLAKKGTYGAVYYCGNGVAQVYEEEGISTSGGWIGYPLEEATSPDIYTSPAIRSPAGKTIAGIRYDVDLFTKGGQKDAGYLACDSSTCGYYNFFPSSWKETVDSQKIRGFVFSEGGEKNEVNFKLVPDLRAGCERVCWVKGEVGSMGNVTLYTRAPCPPAPPAPLPPTFPCETVYGYVRHARTNAGLAGAQIWAHGISTSCFGEHWGCSTAVSGGNGYWSLTCGGSMACLGVYETGNPSGYQDSTKKPIGPPGYWEAFDDSGYGFYNSVFLPNPAVSSCGPFTFYDEPIPTPTPTPSCDCGEWEIEGCGEPCESNQRLESQYCYWSDSGDVCDVDTRCLDDENCLVAWYQTQAGDVHTEGNISSQIPATVPADEKYFSLDGEGGFPGVVSYNGSSADFGDGEVSSQGWLAQESQSIPYTYNYFYQLLKFPPLEEVTDKVVHDSDLPDNDVKAYDGNIQTGSTWNLGTKKLALLINGKFLVKHQIKIDPGGSLVVIAKDGIGLSKNLVAKGQGGNEMHGFFVTDGNFYTSVEENFDFTPADSNKMLVIDGSVVVGGLVDFGRDFSALGGSDDYENDETPVEMFRFDPGLMINSYTGLWQLNFTWQEIVP